MTLGDTQYILWLTSPPMSCMCWNCLRQEKTVALQQFFIFSSYTSENDEYFLTSCSSNLYKSAQYDPFFPMTFTMQILFLFFSLLQGKKTPVGIRQP